MYFEVMPPQKIRGGSPSGILSATIYIYIYLYEGIHFWWPSDRAFRTMIAGEKMVEQLMNILGHYTVIYVLAAIH